MVNQMAEEHHNYLTNSLLRKEISNLNKKILAVQSYIHRRQTKCHDSLVGRYEIKDDACKFRFTKHSTTTKAFK